MLLNAMAVWDLPHFNEKFELPPDVMMPNMDGFTLEKL
jgi:hypothetical protein